VDLIISAKKIAPTNANPSQPSRFQRLTGGTERGYASQPSASHAVGANLLAHEAPSEVTKLLQVWRAGDPKALDALLPLVYDELRRLAHYHLKNERPDHTLQSAALVNEAYFRLVGQELPELESRTHFFAVAAQLMRQILVDYARRHRASKRGGSVCRLTLDEAVALPQRKDVDVVALDDALTILAEVDPRQSRVVELRFFAGLSLEETSQAMGIATATVQRDWTAARAWLHREISRSTTV
jgi:RNA polymerase sigma factor (TIGR02999 family)